MAELMLQDTTATELVDLAKEISKTTDRIKGAEVVSKIREGISKRLDTSQITDWSYFFYLGTRRPLLYFDKVDTSNGIFFNSMFSNFTNSDFTEIPIEKINTSKGVDFIDFCSKNAELTEIASFDTSKAESLAYCFEYCSKLQNAPVLNTPLCKDFSYMYYNCAELKDGGIYDMTGISGISAEPVAWYMFSGCSKLEKLKLKIDKICTSNMTRMFLLNTATETFTDFEIEVVTENGGIKVDDNSFNLSSHNGLSVESLMSVLNALQDNTGESTTYNIYLGDNLAKLTAVQKQIAYSKNINLK